MNQHTPGPWIVKKEIDGVASGRLTSVFGLTEQVATTYKQTRPSCQPSLERAEANARLIAAAPDLLNALDLALSHLGEPECAIWRHVQSVMRDAIAKATQPYPSEETQ